MEYQYIYGPIPSRRLGFSLGISPIPKKVCNYSCIYCQLGRTNHYTNERQSFFSLEEIIKEFIQAINTKLHYDVVSIVGEGEPTLYLGLGELIIRLKRLTDKPICVITNGALLTSKDVQMELMNADIILPSLNAYDEKTFRMINRPLKAITFQETYEALVAFSHEFLGKIWLEIMLLAGINDSDEALLHFKALLENIKYDRLYLNTPVRPPAESYVQTISNEQMNKAVNLLGGISIDLLSNELYQSSIIDDYEAIISNIKRHPMNQFEIDAFLKSRQVKDTYTILDKLNENQDIEKVNYKGLITFRLK